MFPSDTTFAELPSALARLAGAAPGTPYTDALLVVIAEQSASTIEAVSHASITATKDGSPTTVATSSPVATAMDLAQYADNAGPCLEALGGRPRQVPDMASIVSWPGFRRQADQLGLRASLSIPLPAADGSTAAALNLYSDDPEGLRQLTRAVLSLYQAPEPAKADQRDNVGSGGRQLLDGLMLALEVQQTIQLALGALMAQSAIDAPQAYRDLQARAQAEGASLHATATRVLAGRLSSPGADPSL